MGAGLSIIGTSQIRLPKAPGADKTGSHPKEESRDTPRQIFISAPTLHDFTTFALILIHFTSCFVLHEHRQNLINVRYMNRSRTEALVASAESAAKERNANPPSNLLIICEYAFYDLL
jgi:hypothetical protein